MASSAMASILLSISSIGNFLCRVFPFCGLADRCCQILWDSDVFVQFTDHIHQHQQFKLVFTCRNRTDIIVDVQIPSMVCQCYIPQSPEGAPHSPHHAVHQKRTHRMAHRVRFQILQRKKQFLRREAWSASASSSRSVRLATNRRIFYRSVPCGFSAIASENGEAAWKRKLHSAWIKASIPHAAATEAGAEVRSCGSGSHRRKKFITEYRQLITLLWSVITEKSSYFRTGSCSCRNRDQGNDFSRYFVCAFIFGDTAAKFCGHTHYLWPHPSASRHQALR